MTGVVAHMIGRLVAWWFAPNRSSVLTGPSVTTAGSVSPAVPSPPRVLPGPRPGRLTAAPYAVPPAGVFHGKPGVAQGFAQYLRECSQQGWST